MTTVAPAGALVVVTVRPRVLLTATVFAAGVSVMVGVVFCLDTVKEQVLERPV